MGPTLASLSVDKRTGCWYVRFYWNCTQHYRSCHTKQKSLANRTLTKVEEALEVLKRRADRMPEVLSPSLQVEWILSGGKLNLKANTNGNANGAPNANGAEKSDRLGEICSAYLADQAQKQDTTLAGEKIHIKHLKRVLKARTPMAAIDLDWLRAYHRRRANLHQEAIVIDGHVDLINSVFHQGIDPWKAQKTGTFDYARAKEGGLDVAIEHLYIDDSYSTYNYTVKHACRLIETFHRVVDGNPDKMELAVDSQDIRRIVADGKLAVVLALEGGFDMEGDLDVLRLFHRLGVRMIQITNHDTTNSLADAGRDDKWGGISPKGRAVIQEMNRLGIVIDISHASPEAKRQIIEASRAPVVTSHNGLQHFSSCMGNISDKTLRDLAAKGGLIGLHSAGWILQQKSLDWGYHRPRGSPPPDWAELASLKLEFFRPHIDYGKYITRLDSLNRDLWIYRYGYGEPWRVRQRRAILQGAPLPTVEDWANQVDYVVGLVGAEHIALGLDLMSGGHWLRDFDATNYPRITEALVAKGYPADTVRKILGENWRFSWE